MSVAPALASNPRAFATAKLALTPTSVAGDNVLGAGDNSGVLALGAVQDLALAFNAAGGMGAVNVTLGNFAGNVLAAAGAQAAQVDSFRDQNQNLKDDLAQRTGAIEGVNLDEELSNMLMYQKSYNAAARLITTASQIFDSLLQAVQ
jgi:flagellar hook-associated protein 1 FlgK